MSASETGRYRLPGVLDSFIQWCERTREDSQFDPQIQEQLAQRKAPLVLSHTYEQWRRMEQEDPTVCRIMRFIPLFASVDRLSLYSEIE